MLSNNTKLFLCGISISNDLMNDLVPDCVGHGENYQTGYHGASDEDEPIYKDILINHTHYKCKHPKQLYCRHGDPQCYNISDIFIYTQYIWTHDNL